ncbi:MAG: PIN domain-containing protein [Pirellulaceae bacterium]
MPAADCFLDTNILLYSVSTAAAESPKTSIARELLRTPNWAWSAQVAAEFISVSTSPKRSLRLSLGEAEKWIDTWLAFPLAPIDEKTVKLALTIAGQSGISYFDAQILAAAKQLGCQTVYTEDLNRGQDYGGVRVVNPFGAARVNG